jgi:hypothetical protein
MWRMAGLLLAALVLPSCGTDRHRWVRISIHNEGAVSANVHAESESRWSSSTLDELDLTVGPGSSAEFQFRTENMDRLKIRIYRSTDLFKIFDDSWDLQDLDDLDYRVEITVMP